MREGKSFKGVVLAVFATVMMLMFSVPVSAATTGITKLAGGGCAISKGTCVHLLNRNISGNGISSYTYRITPLTAGTKYDIVYAYGGTVKAFRSCHSDLGDITNATYFKSSSQSNVGLIACLKVTSGSVRVRARITASNKNARMGIQQITASHSPLKRTNAIKKGYYIEMTGVGANINEFPLIMAGKSGARVDRRLSVKRKAYEAYDFRNSNMIFRSYTNNRLTKKYQLNYVTIDGSMRYYFMRVPRNSNGNAYTGKMYTKKGSARYYYPADYLKVSGSVRKYK